MSYVTLNIENGPIIQCKLPGFYFLIRDAELNRYPKIHLEYGYTSPFITFHVYMYKLYRTRIITEKVFLCNRYNIKTNTWMGKADIDPNNIIHTSVFTHMYIRFNFNVPRNYRVMSLQALSVFVIGNALQNPEDIQQLLVPKLLKNNFEKIFLEVSESQNSLKGWFFCKNKEKDTLYYFGLPGTQKQLDIHRLTFSKSICTWERLEFIKPENEYIILRITLHNHLYILNDIDYIVDVMKKHDFRDLDQRYPVNHFNNKISAKLIIISDYSPEVFFDRFEEKKWILNNIFVVKKESLWSPKTLLKSTYICFQCGRIIYYEKGVWNNNKLYHKKCLSHLKCMYALST